MRRVAWWVLLISVPLLLGLMTLLMMQRQRTHHLEQQLQLAQEQVTRLLAHNEDLTQQLASLRMERDTVDERVLALSTQLASTGAELEQAKANLAQSQQLSTRLRDVESQLKREQTDHASTHRDLERVEGQKAQLSRSVSHLRQQLALLERDYQGLARQVSTIHPVVPASNSGVVIVGRTDRVPAESVPLAAASPELTPGTIIDLPGRAVELSPVVVRPQEERGRSAVTAPPVRAQLVEVNESQHFIVIDKGSAHGIQEGMLFDLFHASSPAGLAGVVSVRSRFAACRLVRAESRNALSVGDVAVQRSP